MAPRPLPEIERDIAAAERARDDLLYSDDFAATNGAYDRANGLVLRLRRELTDAQVAQIERAGADIVARGQQIAATLRAAGMATTHNEA